MSRDDEREVPGEVGRPNLDSIRRSINEEYAEFRREVGLPPVALDQRPSGWRSWPSGLRAAGRRMAVGLAAGAAGVTGLGLAAAVLLYFAWPRADEQQVTLAPAAVPESRAPIDAGGPATEPSPPAIASSPAAEVSAPPAAVGGAPAVPGAPAAVPRTPAAVSGAPAAVPPARATAASAVEAELREALQDIVAATNRRDLSALMTYYPDTVPVFYRARNVPRDVVRADKAYQLTGAEVLDIRAEPPDITVAVDATATMRFRKHYVVRGARLDRQGTVLHELRWAPTGSGWKIVSERDLRVLATSPPPGR